MTPDVHAFEYAHVSHRLWDAVIPSPPITRVCRRCGLAEIRGYCTGAEFVPLNKPEKPCQPKEGAES